MLLRSSCLYSCKATRINSVLPQYISLLGGCCTHAAADSALVRERQTTREREPKPLRWTRPDLAEKQDLSSQMYGLGPHKKGENSFAESFCHNGTLCGAKQEQQLLDTTNM
jgi:hypothetical protein